jgi:DNA-binding NtrC family response regulator
VRHATRYDRRGLTFDPGALDALRAHPWPGNVRELDHAIERAVLLAQGATVQAADLGLHLSGAHPRLEDLTLAEAERVLIERTLHRFDGNVTQAARALGLSRSALYRRLEGTG